MSSFDYCAKCGKLIDMYHPKHDCVTSMHIGNGEGSYVGATEEQDNDEEEKKVVPCINTMNVQQFDVEQVKSEWDDILDLSSQACQHANQVGAYWSDFVDSAPFDEDEYKPPSSSGSALHVHIIDEDLRSPSTLEEKVKIMTQHIKDLKTYNSRLDEKINKIDTQTRNPTKWERLKTIVLENVAGVIIMVFIVAVLGYLGLSWLLG